MGNRKIIADHQADHLALAVALETPIDCPPGGGGGEAIGSECVLFFFAFWALSGMSASTANGQQQQTCREAQ